MHAEVIYLAAGTWVDIPGGWTTLAVAFLTVVVGPIATVVVTARLSGKVKSIKTDVAATKKDVAATKKDAAISAWHTQNSHLDPSTGEPINQRDDMDAKHGEQLAAMAGMEERLTSRIEGIDGRLDSVERDIRGIQKDVGRLGDSDIEQTRQQNRDRERLDYLEHTIPRDQLGRFIKREETEE